MNLLMLWPNVLRSCSLSDVGVMQPFPSLSPSHNSNTNKQELDWFRLQFHITYFLPPPTCKSSQLPPSPPFSYGAMMETVIWRPSVVGVDTLRRLRAAAQAEEQRWRRKSKLELLWRTPTTPRRKIMSVLPPGESGSVYDTANKLSESERVSGSPPNFTLRT